MSTVQIKKDVTDYMDELRKYGYVVTVTQVPMLPLAMGHYRAEVDVWPARSEACAHCERLPGDPDGSCDWIECPVSNIGQAAHAALNARLAKFRQALAPYLFDNDDSAIAKISDLVRADVASRSSK